MGYNSNRIALPLQEKKSNWTRCERKYQTDVLDANVIF